jgi:hypothetical protein
MLLIWGALCRFLVSIRIAKKIGITDRKNCFSSNTLFE